MKNVRYRFLRNFESCKVETFWYKHKNQGQWPITLGVTSLDRFYKFPLIKKNCYTFLKNCKHVKVTKLKPGTHMERGLMYRVNRN